MGTRATIRLVIAVAFAASSLVVMALPAAAETVLVTCTGTCGYYQVYDTGPTGMKGADCVYLNNNTHPDLAEMTFRPPLMHGYYPNKTKVGWRFKVQREPVNSAQPFKTIYTSPWQTAMANDAIPASVGHGFSRRAWMAPASPHGFFRVVIELQWWHGASVDGMVRLKYDWYKAIRSGHPSYVDMEYCLEDF